MEKWIRSVSTAQCVIGRCFNVSLGPMCHCQGPGTCLADVVNTYDYLQVTWSATWTRRSRRRRDIHE